MNFKDMLDEVKVRGEKIRDEILEELVNSKTLNQIVSNKNFVQAVGRVIETKDEVKRTIRDQVRYLFQAMNVPSKSEFSRISDKIADLEKSIEKIGIQSVAARSNSKTKAVKSARAPKKAATASKTRGRKKSSSRKA